MGTKGTLVLDREQEIMLYKESDTSSRVTVKEGKAGPTMDTQASGGSGRRGQDGREHGAGQPWLHGGDRALGLVHSQQSRRRTSPAASRRSPWATP